MTGSWQFWDQDPAPESRAHITNYRKSPSDTIFFQDSPGVVAGALFADALNVHEATGLTPAQLQSRVAELEAALRVAAESIIKLESIATESGAEAYDIACEEMEAWQAKRRKAGKEVGTRGSLVDGLAWVYERLDDLESGQ